ncbi:hypothetical protein [Streptomyces sp. NPDC020983]|uniref:hypothetical protein n=1 Tax=Streptomyces sp. NPDC020983 TaxID=3365106 RepID=UPI0037B4146A
MSAAVVVIAALVVWAVTRGGGGGGKGTSAPSGSHTPVGTITAGPTPSGTHISGRPGGRDTDPGDTDGGNSAGATAGSAGTAGDTAGSGDGTAGSGDGTAAGSSAGTDAGTGGGGSGGADGTGGTAVQVPAGSPLPNCTSATVTLALTTDQNQYPAGQYPAFTLRATNSGAADCKLDVGAVSAVLDVTKDPDNSHVWSSADCPPSKSPYLIRIPAHSSAAHTVRWNGRTSSPECASPKGAPATAGNYLAQVTVPGFGVKQRSFSLSAS